MLPELPLDRVAACSVSDRTARRLVLDALAAVGARACEVPAIRLAAGHPAVETCTVLIYDLEPMTDAAVSLVRTLRERHPSLPILLYPPLREGVIPLVLAAGRIAGVTAKGQLRDSREPARLRRFIGRTLASAPVTRLTAIVSALLEGAPRRLHVFAATALRRLAAPTPASDRTVAAVAADLHLAPRTLQRAVADDRFPQPKEMLDWLTLLFVTYVAGWSDVSMRNVARLFQVDPHTFYRLRRRLLPGAPRPGQTDLQQEFDLVLLAFAKRCRVPKRRTEQALQRALG